MRSSLDKVVWTVVLLAGRRNIRFSISEMRRLPKPGLDRFN
jgi:hypothetical protein